MHPCLSRLLLPVLLTSGALHAATVPVLPSIPYDYEGIVLPAHYLTNQIPGNSPFQSAAIASDNTPADNPITNDGATLGRVLFYDRKLSANGTIACASCHQQDHAFADAARLSRGFAGGTTRRHSMGLTNARFYEPGKFFWDERAASLEAQVLMPFQDATEMGLSLDQLVGLVSAQSYYPPLFASAFGDRTINADRIAQALAQFVRTIVSTNSRYDQGRATVTNPLAPFPNFTAQENQGKQIFMDTTQRRVACIDCHVTEAFISPPRGTPHASATSATTNNGLDAVSTTDLGVAETTGNVADTGHFKVPSLRNVAVRPPYMHDGRFNTLEEVLNFYDNGIRNHAQLSNILRNPQGNAVRINLNGNDRNAVAAFLRTLTDNTLLTDPKYSDPFVDVPDAAPHLVNLSTGARAGSGSAVLVSGFVVGGTTPKSLLIRGVGPQLADFGVTNTLSQPSLRLFAGTTEIAHSLAWSAEPNAAAIATTAARIGAFALAPTGTDSAMLTTVEPGAYSVHLASADGTPGYGMVEIYDADADTAATLRNLSARAQVAAGDQRMISGFVVQGTASQTFLIRAIGPGLTSFGVTDAMADPQLTVYSGDTVVTTNDDWAASGNAAQTESVATAVGAFALDPNSHDAAVTVSLSPGAHTVHVADATHAGGTLLIEIYAVP